MVCMNHRIIYPKQIFIMHYINYFKLVSFLLRADGFNQKFAKKVAVTALIPVLLRLSLLNYAALFCSVFKIAFIHCDD